MRASERAAGWGAGVSSEGPDKVGVIVIGAGFGGLAAAIRLAAGGTPVRLLEARDQAGGRAGRIRDGGFVFDAGPTLITAPSLLRDLWELAGRSLDDDVDIRPLEPYYRILFPDGRSFDYSGDPAQFDAQISAFNPPDVDGYHRLLAATGEIYQRAFVELGRAPFHQMSRFLRVVPGLVRLGGLRSVYDYTSRYIEDPSLRTVFSFHPLFIGGNPFRATAIYSIVPWLERQDGVHFAMGGMHSLVSAMVDLLRDLGGEICYGAQVRRIVTERRQVTGVELESGERIPATRVIANSDAATTLLEMVPEEDRSALWSWRWRNARYSMSCFLLYLGLNRTYPELAHHTIYMPQDFRRTVTDIFDRKRIPAEIPMYIHTPTRTDPSMAPDGCESMYVLVPVPNLSGGIDWQQVGDTLRERVMDQMERQIGLAGFRDAIQVEHRFTPIDFRDELGSRLGAAFSFEPTLAQSAYFRPTNKSREVEGLYLVGAGTHPGAGIPGVLLSAEITADLVQKCAQGISTSR